VKSLERPREGELRCVSERGVSDLGDSLREPPLPPPVDQRGLSLRAPLLPPPVDERGDSLRLPLLPLPVDQRELSPRGLSARGLSLRAPLLPLPVDQRGLSVRGESERLEPSELRIPLSVLLPPPPVPVLRAGSPKVRQPPRLDSSPVACRPVALPVRAVVPAEWSPDWRFATPGSPNLCQPPEPPAPAPAPAPEVRADSPPREPWSA